MVRLMLIKLNIRSSNAKGGAGGGGALGGVAAAAPPPPPTTTTVLQPALPAPPVRVAVVVTSHRELLVAAPYRWCMPSDPPWRDQQQVRRLKTCANLCVKQLPFHCSCTCFMDSPL